MIWEYRSDVGTFSIRPQQSNPGHFALYVGTDFLGSYHSPQAAADEVHDQATGHYPWDSVPRVACPADLEEWRRVR